MEVCTKMSIKHPLTQSSMALYSSGGMGREKRQMRHICELREGRVEIDSLEEKRERETGESEQDVNPAVLRGKVTVTQKLDP